MGDVRRWMIGLVLLACGCAAVDQEAFEQNMYLGKHNYDHGKFDESALAYGRCLDMRTGYYPAVLGMANAAAEQSHMLYQKATDILMAGKGDAGGRLLGQADDWAERANKAFALVFKLRPHDVAGHYGFGLFLYKRMSAKSNVPHPRIAEPPPDMKSLDARAKWAAGYEQRVKERNEAIRQFELVLADDPPGAGTPQHVRNGACKSDYAHRYLGLALFSRSDWTKRDGERARIHLQQFLLFLQWWREILLKQPANTDEAKSTKERDMRIVETELIEVRDLLRERLNYLAAYGKDLKEVTEKDREVLTPTERQQRLASIAVEQEALTVLVRDFDRAAATAAGSSPK